MYLQVGHEKLSKISEINYLEFTIQSYHPEL